MTSKSYRITLPNNSPAKKFKAADARMDGSAGPSPNPGPFFIDSKRPVSPRNPPARGPGFGPENAFSRDRGPIPSSLKAGPCRLRESPAHRKGAFFPSKPNFGKRTRMTKAQ